ncbi:glycosyltransferase family 2 protein [Ruminiclostridium cellobioparum]|uniref:glycosyltransferase family 2 protein n=1 Tax=Ruminiclostridium cellobioparum TaxID=29355 RepID=UPI0028AC10B8|nr:glycosyltransferase family 2 protein [Ruminiclostridium cellobioparum]
MSKVIFYTPAYNAEKTLRRTVDSVLTQTYTEFVYYLLDNAATDNTQKIIKEYAERDERIIPLYNEVNWYGNWILDVIKNHGDDCWVCELDADDEYKPDFLEKMIEFIQENNLDIAACGNDFIDAQTNRVTSIRKLDKSLILAGDSFNKYFPQYHQFMRTIWGKMYSLSVLRKPDYKKYVVPGYGSDTIFAMKAFHNAKRVGILGESLHKYYISSKSVSYQIDVKRIISDQVLFEATHDFLISKCGSVNHDNLNFLFIIYLNAIMDTINVIINSQIKVIDKLFSLRDIFQSQHTQELVQWTGFESQKNNLFRQVAVWLLSKKEICNEIGLETVADILSAMGIHPTQISGWQDGWVFLLLVKLKDRAFKKGLADNIDKQIFSIASKSEMLAELNAEFLSFFREIIFSILQSDEKKALCHIEEMITQEIDIPNEYIEDFLKLGLNLSAKLEYSDDFIYFKKLQITFLIDLSRVGDAQKELADWDEILPDDMDFKELRVRLT